MPYVAQRKAGGGVNSFIKVDGSDKLDAVLKMLKAQTQKAVLRPSLRAAAKPVQAEAKMVAPVQTRLLKNSIKVRAIKRNRRGVIGVQVRTGKGDYKGETFYGAFQEYGYRLGSRKLGNKRKQIPGKHYMEKAFENKKEESVRAFTAEARKRLLDMAVRGVIPADTVRDLQ